MPDPLVRATALDGVLILNKKRSGVAIPQSKHCPQSQPQTADPESHSHPSHPGQPWYESVTEPLRQQHRTGRRAGFHCQYETKHWDSGGGRNEKSALTIRLASADLACAGTKADLGLQPV